MAESYYRTGQAAKQLGISSYHVRRLCQAGEIAAELTEGQQWRIASSEIARLLAEGIPPVPVEIPEDDNDDGTEPPSRAASAHAGDIPEGLYAGPSEAVIEAAEEVKIVENRLRRRRLEREAEEVEDWFRERQRQRASEAEAQRQKIAATQTAERRRVWIERWTQRALEAVPSTAPREIELAVYAEVRAALEPLRGSEPDTLIGRLVTAAAEKALAPWRRAEDIRRAIDAGMNRLPFVVRHGSEHAGLRQQAWEAAAAAVARISGHTSLREMEAAAKQAIEPMIRALEHAEACQRVTAAVYVAGANWEEQTEARQSVQRALAALPVGASRQQMEKAREAALAPLEARIAQRQETARREAERQSQRRSAEWRVVFQMDHIDRILREEYEFDGGYAERLREAARLRQVIEPLLVEDVLADPEMGVQDIRERIEELIEEHLL